MGKKKAAYKNRINMFDFSKGTAMLLILSVYTLHDYEFYRGSVLEFAWMFIAFPGTAALFLIMGYWYQNKTMKQLLWELKESSFKMYWIAAIATMVTIPLFGWTFPNELSFSFARSGGAFVGYLLGYDSSVMLGQVPVVEIGAMWYVLVYMLAIICVNLLLHIKVLRESTFAMPVVVFIFSALGISLTLFHMLPFCIPEVLVAIQTVYYGYLLREKKLFNRKWKLRDWMILGGSNIITIAILLALGFTIGFGFVFGRTTMLFAVPAGILLIRLGQFLQSLNKRWTNCVCAIGRQSLTLMVIFSVESNAISWRRLIDSSIMPGNEIINCIIVLIIRVLLYALVIIGSLFVKSMISTVRRRRNMQAKKRREDAEKLKAEAYEDDKAENTVEVKTEEE